jgi:hypothetical protein
VLLYKIPAKQLKGGEILFWLLVSEVSVHHGVEGDMVELRPGKIIVARRRGRGYLS